MQPETASIQPTAVLLLNSHSPRTVRLSRAKPTEPSGRFALGLRQLKAGIMRGSLTEPTGARTIGTHPPSPQELVHSHCTWVPSRSLCFPAPRACVSHIPAAGGKGQSAELQHAAKQSSAVCRQLDEDCCLTALVGCWC